MIAADALADAIKVLNRAGVPDAPRDARKLLVDALGINPGRISLILSDPMPIQAQKLFETHIAARSKRQPVAQIIGARAFYGRDFIVTPDVLDPRPDTETLIGVALQKSFETVLDLGVGSGCILLTLLAERPHANGIGVDLSAAALNVARRNAQSLELQDRAQFQQSDWFENITGLFDLIVSNPPYIAQSEMTDLSPDVRDWEPQMALTPGGDGLQPYRTIAAKAANHLTANGCLIVEIGASQGLAVQQIFQQQNLENIAIYTDLDGRDRVVSAKTGKKAQV
ncbi:peptide chain release factor N(5)-glutamine methyltransferase [Parasulfitobacter algicola]|uniref:Release factor glutamine methyltransferase n=1 Tax=Parasulfitobacter algicola TaxID=2614809 RepID=A0ABX2ISZ1_9RHOB|nr:peptide chain release factor N(5)-glutamine methyltransferase [Sulfitobacter algicola]NSX55445.1 peptide chain release factor N(5)-glutamine methyltransferase [Sulfitobacter algicola]